VIDINFSRQVGRDSLLNPIKSEPLFSIFLPVRNGWPYIQECVESILGQSYKNFELNILDNNSTDNTFHWLKSLGDPRIRIWLSDSDLSIEKSWDRIRGMPKLEYMTMIGHDDMFDSDFLMVIKNLIDLHPTASLYQTSGRFINYKGNAIRAFLPVPIVENVQEYIIGRLTFKRDISGTGVVMRSNDYDRVGGIPLFEKLFFADDVLWLSLMQGSYKVSSLSCHYSIRTHLESASGSLTSKCDTIIRGLNQFVAYLNSLAEVDKDIRLALRIFLPKFLIKYYRNAYMYRLIEASYIGHKISNDIFKSLQRSFVVNSYPSQKILRRSVTIMIIEAINASPFSKATYQLWLSYRKFLQRGR